MLNRLEMLRIFLAAAESSNFKEAATRLGISPQAVTRAVQDLEAAQGELLFHRSTRNVQITAFGEQLAARARPGLEQVDALFQRGQAQEEPEMRGSVRLTAPVFMGRLLLLPVLARLTERHPKLRFDLRLSDAHADVVDEKIDIGIRFGFLHDNRFVARRVSRQTFHVVGTPALIARVGRPTTITRLNDVPTTALFDASTGRLWPWLFANGQQMTPAQPAFVCNDSETELDFMRTGAAFGQATSLQAGAAIAAGELVPMLQDFEPEPWDVYVYRPQRGPLPARIRLVYDALVDAFTSMPDVPDRGQA
jgi:DNA-binding transcriptional LysR family regulator